MDGETDYQDAKSGEVGMTVREAIITLNANVIFACERSGFDSTTVKMIEDALDTIEDALKAQEPRLLRLDEIKMLGLMWHESHNGFVQPVICQNYEYGVDRSVEFIMVHGTICNSINTFGKLWRVWTSKPTDAQREAVKWDK